MTSGVLAVAKKELREHRAEIVGSGHERALAAIPILMTGVFMPLVLGDLIVAPGGLAGVAGMFAGSVISARSGDSIAGERDRRTIDVLFATPLKDADIVLGKIVGLTALGVIVTVLSLLAMLPLLVVRHPVEMRAAVHWITIPMILVPATLSSVFVAGIGVAVSTRAPSARTAQGRMGAGILVFMFAPLAVGMAMSERQRSAVAQMVMGLPEGPAIAAAAALFLLVDAAVVSFALARFRRSRTVVL